MVSYIVIAVVIILVVLVLTLVSISKGYDYKHTVDPMPDEKDEASVYEQKDRTS
ncbi:YtzI protein [Virgibacillus ndiopensis]|uniref:YtzI protein n=1 Tax=Virgibacillus ndiopensis TaxID=2004408 RepID=UPI000C08B9B8|nr:YtzI protein [Virgibacillus ndiopensis]